MIIGIPKKMKMNCLKRNHNVVFVVMLGLFYLSSCKEKPLAPDEMKDAAGNRYKTVVIGNQVLAENLKALYTNTPNGFTPEISLTMYRPYTEKQYIHIMPPEVLPVRYDL